MIFENDMFIMQGIPSEDPNCIHTIEELEERIAQIGFLPLFAGEVPGFSVEEMTDPMSWWTDDPAVDPWDWRGIIARRGNAAYGKFFDNKAGFISREWFPAFANYRRSGYDFDARWDDELASIRQKKIMDLFMEPLEDNELFSYELKEKAGFSKGGEKNFEGTLTSLEMMTYLVCRDFRQRKNKRGEAYGWSIAILCTPEHLFGQETVCAEYHRDPKESLEEILAQIRKFYPEALPEQILRTVGSIEDRPKKGRAARRKN